MFISLLSNSPLSLSVTLWCRSDGGSGGHAAGGGGEETQEAEAEAAVTPVTPTTTLLISAEQSSVWGLILNAQGFDPGTHRAVTERSNRRGDG